MGKRALTSTSRVGGYSFDKKQGTKNSYAYGQSIEVRKRPTQVTLKPKTVKESGSNVTTEVTDAVREPNNGDIYLAGGTKIYKRTPESAGGTGTWSTFSSHADLSNVQSLLYKNDIDAILAVDDTVVHKIKDMSGTPTLENSKYGNLLDQQDITGSNTYTLTTGVNEGATHLLSYTPELEPLATVQVYVVAKGTGDWTLTMHDDANNSLGTVTILNANLTNGAYNTFTFSTPIRMLAKPNARTYHFHLTSTVADGTVQTGTASSFATANYKFHASRLVTADYHPIAEFLQFVCIGNERYLTVWESLSDDPAKSEWESHRLTFPSDYEVNGLAVYDEYLAISAYKKRSSDYGGEFGQDSTEGILFFWDGISTTYNYYVIIPEGAPESLTSHKNVLYYIANGREYAWAGGQPVLIRAFPGVDDFTSTNSHDADVYLQAPYNGIDVSEGVMQIGFPYKTVNENIKHGVYSWGSHDKNYPESFGYDHVPSHGRTQTVFANSGSPPDPISGITMVKAFGANMFIAWRDSADSGATTSYGVDIVKASHDAYASGSLENLIFDHNRAWKDKLAIEYDITFESLPSGCSVTPKYKLDRASSWTNGTTVNTAGSTSAHIHLNKRFKEIQTGYDLVGSSSGTPTIISDTLLFDDLESEGI